MDQSSLESILADIHLPAIRYLDRIDSTNDEAWRWVEAGAPDRALVIADEQTAGRGRSGRRWITPPGAGLAFSLVLLSPPLEPGLLTRMNGLGAIAVRSALLKKYNLPAQIKWPNDVLVNQRKLCGELAEAHWSGNELKAAILGIGINIAPDSVSVDNLPPAGLNFPATCVENELGYPLDRLEILHAILSECIGTWLPRLPLPSFIQEWEAALAFRDEWVEISAGTPGELPVSYLQGGPGPMKRITGKVAGLTGDGSLKLVTGSGNMVTVAAGEIHLRPLTAGDTSMPVD